MKLKHSHEAENWVNEGWGYSSPFIRIYFCNHWKCPCWNLERMLVPSGPSAAASLLSARSFIHPHPHLLKNLINVGNMLCNMWWRIFVWPYNFRRIFGFLYWIIDWYSCFILFFHPLVKVVCKNRKSPWGNSRHCRALLEAVLDVVASKKKQKEGGRGSSMERERVREQNCKGSISTYRSNTP